MNREAGFYWVCCFGSDEPQVASWDGKSWDFCGAESNGYAEPDDPTGERVHVVSERLIPPNGYGSSIDMQLKSVGIQIIESEKSRNHIESGKLGKHIDALFDAMSALSK